MDAVSPDVVGAVVVGPITAAPRSHLLNSTEPSNDGGALLSRRSRVRRKTSSSTHSSSDAHSNSGEQSSGLFVKIPPPDSHAGTSPRSGGFLRSRAPPRPERSPKRLLNHPVNDQHHMETDEPLQPRQRRRSHTDSMRPMIEDVRGREACSENGERRSGQRPRGLSLPRHAFRNGSLSDSSEQPSPLTPNAFNDIPPIPVFARNQRYRHRPQDSGFTHQSTTSSSVYPKSTSTESSYPSPPSLPAQDMDDRHIITVDPEDNPHLSELHEMDADDVSYRLRLLMQNTYYLPPAHSKPFAELSPSIDAPKKSPLKAASPAFFDIFKFGKKQNTAAEQKASLVPAGPMLRTTSDTSTFSGFLSPQIAKQTKQQLPIPVVPQLRQEPKKGRVVVVRERMEDLEAVARQVEEDLRIREAERRRNTSQSSHSEAVQDDLVDPTDSVDLPPAPLNIFFGPQSSILNGMGIESSVGAALLADQLPPSSPAMWSTDSEDMVWRKAILHAAVDHSMNNTPVATPSRSRSSSSPFLSLDAAASPPPPVPPLSPTLLQASKGNNKDTRSSESPVPTNESSYPLLRKTRILGQRILSQMIDEELDRSSPSNEAITDNDAKLPNITEKALSLNIKPSSGYEPVRSTSPTVPTTPLLPPPRRLNTMSILSSDGALEIDPTQGSDKASSHLQASQSIPVETRLSDEYATQFKSDAIMFQTSLLASHDGSQHNSATLSAVKPMFGEGSNAISDGTSGSQYSDDDQETSRFHTPREHTLASTQSLSRPSLNSMNSVSSSRTSAFHEFDHHESSASNSVVNTLGNNSRCPSRNSDVEDVRFTAMSPPPRVSSSLAYSALSPAPRPRIVTSPMPIISISEGQTYEAEEEDPGTPTGPVANRLSSLYPPNPASTPSSYPTSPISFFDAVEEQNNQDDDGNFLCFDDDDDEQEEDLEDNGSIVSSIVNSHYSDPCGSVAGVLRTGSSLDVSRIPPAPFTQYRNTSSPQLSQSSKIELGSGLGYDARDRRAIGHVPPIASHGTSWYTKPEKQREQQVVNPPRLSESTADRVKHEAAKRNLLGEKNRPRTTGSNTEQHVWSNQSAGSSNVQAWRNEQNRQDQSMRRLDGLLIQHMEREKEVLKRITTTLSKPSPT